jgi:hypothetical protein
MLGAELIRRAIEVQREVLFSMDVGSCGFLRVIAKLQFFEQ